MRKFLFFVAIVMPLSVLAETVEIEGIYYDLTNKLKTAEVIVGDKEYEGNIVIPSTIQYKDSEFQVTSIGNNAFHKCTKLLSVIIPNSVQTIGYNLFSYSPNLVSVSIGDGIKVINDFAFYECNSLTSVTLGNNVQTINRYAFGCCSSLKSITIPRSVKSIGLLAFDHECSSLSAVHISDLEAWCNIKFEEGGNPLVFAKRLYLNNNEITTLEIPNSIESIESKAFQGCKSIVSVKFPDHLRSIGFYAFSGCSNLETMTLPSSITLISGTAFSGCTSLKSVTIPASVETIGNDAFSGCTNLEELTIEDGVKQIGTGAFAGCTKLYSLEIPNSITTISNLAFSQCEALRIIKVGKDVETIGQGAFGNCKEITDVYCFAEVVPNTSESAFINSLIDYATLHVPTSSIESYRASMPWKGFKNIIALSDNDTSIKVGKSDNANIDSYFDLKGQKIDANFRGISIVRKSNGEVIKVISK